MQRRDFLAAGIGLAGFGPTVCPSLGTAAAEHGEILYNGIQLPARWPPRRQALSFEPMSVPYLAAPPDVIPIDVGRQLFVDDFLIAETTLTRTFHRTTYHPATPVLKPD